MLTKKSVPKSFHVQHTHKKKKKKRETRLKFQKQRGSIRMSTRDVTSQPPPLGHVKQVLLEFFELCDTVMSKIPSLNYPESSRMLMACDEMRASNTSKYSLDLCSMSARCDSRGSCCSAMLHNAAPPRDEERGIPEKSSTHVFRESSVLQLSCSAVCDTLLEGAWKPQRVSRAAGALSAAVPFVSGGVVADQPTISHSDFNAVLFPQRPLSGPHVERRAGPCTSPPAGPPVRNHDPTKESEGEGEHVPSHPAVAETNHPSLVCGAMLRERQYNNLCLMNVRVPVPECPTESATGGLPEVLLTPPHCGDTDSTASFPQKFSPPKLSVQQPTESPPQPNSSGPLYDDGAAGAPCNLMRGDGSEDVSLRSQRNSSMVTRGVRTNDSPSQLLVGRSSGSLTSISSFSVASINDEGLYYAGAVRMAADGIPVAGSRSAVAMRHDALMSMSSQFLVPVTAQTTASSAFTPHCVQWVRTQRGTSLTSITTKDSTSHGGGGGAMVTLLLASPSSEHDAGSLQTMYSGTSNAAENSLAGLASLITNLKRRILELDWWQTPVTVNNNNNPVASAEISNGGVGKPIESSHGAAQFENNPESDAPSLCPMNKALGLRGQTAVATPPTANTNVAARQPHECMMIAAGGEGTQCAHEGLAKAPSSPSIPRNFVAEFRTLQGFIRPSSGPVGRLCSDGTCERLPMERVLSIVRQAAAGLEYLHNHGIVHRDVKPDNILMDSSGRVYLSDFALKGLTGTTHTPGHIHTSPMYVGTDTPLRAMREALFFTPPEVLRQLLSTSHSGDDEAALSPAIDMWALGVTAVSLLRGSIPFNTLHDIESSTEPTVSRVVEDALAASVSLTPLDPERQALHTILCGLLAPNAAVRLTAKMVASPSFVS